MIAKPKSLNYKSYISTLLLFLFSATIVAQEYYEESYADQFAVDQNTRLEIDNRHGNVNINTWSKDSVRIEIDVAISAKNDDRIDRQLDRLDIQIKKSGGYITAKSNFDKDLSIVGEVLQATGDIGRTIMASYSLNIDYEVHAPSYMEMDISNKFGNISLPDLEGELEVVLSHGKLKADRLDNLVSLELSNGDADISFLNETNMDVLYSDIEIDEVTELDLKSSGSEYHLRKIGTLLLNSRNDEIYADQIDTISGDVVSSDISTKSLNETIDLDMKYGTLKLRGIEETLESVDLTCKNGDVDFEFIPTVAFSFDIELVEADEIRLNKSLLDIQQNDQEDETIQLRGVSKNGAGSAKMRLRLEGTDLTIDDY